MVSTLDVADIGRARARLRGAVYETPCAYSETLSKLSGTRCHVKLENLQMTGSLKGREAPNRLLQLDAQELLDQCPAMEAVVVPVGGGCLLAGVSLAIRTRRPDVRVIGVQSSSAASSRTGGWCGWAS
jgi:threonine dehydratase